MHFDGLFNCSKGHFNTCRQSLKTVIRSRVSHSILYLKEKYRNDDEGGGERVRS